MAIETNKMLEILMENKETNKGRLTRTEIAEFKALLLAKREEILGNVISMEGGTLRRQRSDLSNMADLGTDNFDQELTLGLMDSERKLISEIDDALDRIEEGTYGICEGSGKPIPEDRLKAIPWARYCIKYANMLEKGLVEKFFDVNQTAIDYGDSEQDEKPGKPFHRKAI